MSSSIRLVSPMRFWIRGLGSFTARCCDFASAFAEEPPRGTRAPFLSLPYTSMCQQQTESGGVRFLRQSEDRHGRTTFVGKASDRALEAERSLLRGVSAQVGH